MHMRASVLCVSETAFWVVPQRKEVGHPFNMLLNDAPLRLRRPSDEQPSGRTSVHFVARQRLEPYWDEDRSEYRCGTRGYWYTVSDESLKEIVSWHWHPANYPSPHVHVEGGYYGHIPTGRVTFESVIRFMLEELEVIPARSSWRRILAEQEDLHRQYRTWH